MTSLRIRGLVRVAERVRRDLARPTSAEERGQLRRDVANALEQVREILAGHAAVLNDLPAPTRRAYQFLTQLNIDDAPSATTAQTQPRPAGSVSVVGLPSFWQRILDRLARVTTAEASALVYDSLRQASMNIERHLEQQALGGSQLTFQTRTIRGWLAFFAERANFDEYVAALNRAKPALETALRTTARFQSPALVHFRPTSGLYGFPRSPLPTQPASTLADFGLPEATTLDDLEHLVALARELAVRHVVYSPAKIVRPRGRKLSPTMQALRKVYEACARPERPVFHGGSWRLPPTVAQDHVVRPFLEICRRHGVATKHCKHSLIGTP